MKREDILNNSLGKGTLAEINEMNKYIDFLENRECKTCVHFMAKHSYRLGYSLYLNDCKVPLADANFSCSDFKKKEK